MAEVEICCITHTWWWCPWIIKSERVKRGRRACSRQMVSSFSGWGVVCEDTFNWIFIAKLNLNLLGYFNPIFHAKRQQHHPSFDDDEQWGMKSWFYYHPVVTRSWCLIANKAYIWIIRMKYWYIPNAIVLSESDKSHHIHHAPKWTEKKRWPERRISG